MKRLILISVMFLLALTLSAQKLNSIAQPANNTFSQSKDTCTVVLQLLGVDVATFGQTTVHYTYQQPGHTYQFSAYHGIVTSYTATTVTVMWNVQPYSWGYVHMIETDEYGCVDATSHPVIIIP